MTYFTVLAGNRFYWARYVVRAETPETAENALQDELVEAAREDERANEGNDPHPSEAYEYFVREIEPLDPEPWHLAFLGDDDFALLDSANA